MAFTPRQYRSHIDRKRGWPPMSHTLIVTLPFVTLRMLKPTVGIMSSQNWPDWSEENENKKKTKYVSQSVSFPNTDFTLE